MSTQLSLVLVHELTGRIRLKLSRVPEDQNRFLDSILIHDGLQQATFNPVSRSLVITFTGEHLTTEEILLRTAIAFSMEFDFRPVRVLVATGTEVMTDGALLAGVLLLVAGIVNLGGARNGHLLSRAAGIGVAAAVVQHGWQEAKEQGYVHPELLSLGYLFASMIRGTILRGAAVTWTASFGRHLLAGEEKCIEVRPIQQGSESDNIRTYQVALVPQGINRSPLLSLAQSMLGATGFAGFAGSGDTLFQEFKNVAQAHDEVIEGLDLQPDGIPLIFRRETS
jgi:hypothetical protein